MYVFFLSFLGVLLKKELKPAVFATRKKRGAMMAFVNAYAKLSRVKYIDHFLTIFLFLLD
jgi:hypothetical protein